jgi:hypothetical protein
MPERFEVLEFEAGDDRQALRKLMEHLEANDNRVLIGCWNVPGDGFDTVAIQATISIDEVDDD